MLSLLLMSVVPLVRTASNVVDTVDVQHDIKREHKKKFYELLDADLTEKQLKGDFPNKYWMLKAKQYNDLIRKIETGLVGITDKAEYNSIYAIRNSYEVLEICDIKKITKKRK